MELAFSREQGAMFVGDRGGEVHIRIVAIPSLEHGGHVATQNQQAILVGFDDPGGVNQRFIEQEGGASRGFDLMDHGRIFHRRRDDILLRDIRGHLVRTGDHRRAPVLGAQIRQIRERFDKREVVKAKKDLAASLKKQKSELQNALSSAKQKRDQRIKELKSNLKK